MTTGGLNGRAFYETGTTEGTTPSDAAARGESWYGREEVDAMEHQIVVAGTETRQGPPKTQPPRVSKTDTSGRK